MLHFNISLDDLTVFGRHRYKEVLLSVIYFLAMCCFIQNYLILVTRSSQVVWVFSHISMTFFSYQLKWIRLSAVAFEIWRES